MSAGDLEARLKTTQENLTKNPDDLRSLVDQGVIYFHMGPEHYAPSLNALNQAWRAGAFDERIFYYSGILYENLSFFDEAQKQYDRFLKHRPADREIQLRQARLLFRMGRWDDSIQAYQKFVDENPKDLTSLVNLGLAYRKKLDLEAEDRKRAGSKSDPIADEAWLTEARKGIGYLERARALQADLPEGVPLALSRLYADTGQWEPSLQAAEFELHQSTSADALKSALQACEKLDRKERALELATKLTEIEPNVRAWRNKVRALKSQLAKK